METDTAGGGGDPDDKSDVCDEPRVATVVCGVWGNYDAGAEVDEVFLRGAEAEADWLDGDCDTGGDSDDATDYTVLFWEDFTDFGGGEFADTTDTAVGDGADIPDWRGGGGAGSGGGGGLVCDEIARIPYCGGGVVWRDEAVFNRDAAVSRMGVGYLCGSANTIDGWRGTGILEKTKIWYNGSK